MHEEEVALVQSCLRGDESAWRRFVDRYGRLIFLVIQRTGHAHGSRWTDEEVEDLCAEVFAALLKDGAAKLRGYAPRYALSTYLGVVARSTTLDLLRSRRPTSPLQAVHTEPAADPETADPPRVLSEEESRKVVAGILDSLAPRERLVVELFYYSGKKYREIAEILRIPLNTVCSTLARALEKLRARLKAGPGNP